MQRQPTGSDLKSPIGCDDPALRTSPMRRKELWSPGICLACTSGTCLATAIGALVWFGVVRWGSELHGTNRTEKPFCCTSEAAALFAVIDRNEYPCTDFFEYICKHALDDGFVQSDVANDLLEDVRSSIIKGTQNYGSQAATALHALFTSCIQEIWQGERRARDTVAVVLEIANHTRRMSGADLLRFGLTVQKRYRLRFFFMVHYSPRTLAKWIAFDKERFRMIDYKRDCDASFYAVALSTLSAHFRTNCTGEEMSKLEKKFSLPVEKSERFSLVVISEAFGGLEVSKFKAILLEFLISIDQLEEPGVESTASLLADIRLLSDPRYQPMSLCYMLLIVALNALRYVQMGHKVTRPTVASEELCHTHVFQSTQLWRVTYVAALATPAKDRQLHTIFDVTRRSFVEYPPILRIVAAGNDTNRFRELVSNMSLMLPGDFVFHEPAVPNLTARGFVRNLFMALSFEFDAKKEKAQRGVPVIQDDSENKAVDRIYFLNATTLYVSSPGYGWLSSGLIDPLLADAAVIASRMAALMWVKVVQWEGWSSETRTALTSHSECLLSKSFNLTFLNSLHSLVAHKHGLQIAAIVGAAGTAFTGHAAPAALRASWYKMQDAWSLSQMSEAQFFYARFAYYRCSTAYYAKSLLIEVVRGNADFEAAFQCSQSSKFAKISDCLNITVLHI